jgi:hypothetical protein
VLPARGHNIAIHTVYYNPGPLLFVKAPRKPFSRNKVNKDILIMKMLQFLNLPQNLEKYASGRKIVVVLFLEPNILI